MKRYKKFLIAFVALVCAVSVFFGACSFGDIIPHEHSFKNYVADGNATCTKNGTETAKCEKCTVTDTREIADSKKPHSFVTYKPNNDATCTKNGTETAKCENCSETDTREQAGSIKEHQFINYKSNDDATCTANGTETAKCENCTETSTRVQQNSIKEHSFTNFIPNGDATTESDGTKTAKCDYCSATKTVTDEGSKLEGEHTHSYTQSVIEPTCTEKGYTLFECACGISQYKDIFVDELGHSFTNYVSDGNATVEADGTKTAKCDRCEETDTVVDAGSKLPYDGKPVAGSKDEIDEAKFSIHFLELGNKYTGDCTLIKCGDTEVLIDAGSRQNSAAEIKKYVDQYCTDGVLEYVIATHAHQDHIAGFVGNKSGSTQTGILYQYRIGTLIQFGKTDVTTAIYRDYLTAVDYAKSKGTTVYTATQCWYETDGAKKQYFLDEEKTLSMNILYNYYYENKTSDENDYSVCMLLTNTVGANEYNYLFTGDLEEDGESRLVDNNDLPEVELFKGGHHGSYTASNEKLLSVIKPKNIAVCCCCGSPEYTQNPDNTFPAQAFIDRVSKYTDRIYVTTMAIDVPAIVDGKIPSKTWNYQSMNGNIVFYFKNNWKLYCSNNDTILKDTEWFKENRVWRAS